MNAGKITDPSDGIATEIPWVIVMPRDKQG